MSGKKLKPITVLDRCSRSLFVSSCGADPHLSVIHDVHNVVQSVIHDMHVAVQSAIHDVNNVVKCAIHVNVI